MFMLTYTAIILTISVLLASKVREIVHWPEQVLSYPKNKH